MKAQVKTNNKGSLNMRDKPSTSGIILEKIPYGTYVEVIEEKDGWTQISLKDRYGYVMTKYLDVYNGDQPEPTISKADLQAIYDKLNEALKLIKGVLK